MKRLIGAGVVALAALALVGCSNIKSGTIHDKQYNAGHYYTSYTCASYSKSGACTVHVPIQNYVPPSYEFDLYQSKDKHGWHYVDAITYSKYKVGDYYSDEGK